MPLTFFLAYRIIPYLGGFRMIFVLTFKINIQTGNPPFSPQISSLGLNSFRWLLGEDAKIPNSNSRKYYILQCIIPKNQVVICTNRGILPI